MSLAFCFRIYFIPLVLSPEILVHGCIPMINALFVYNGKGEVLLSRLFRDGVRRNVCEVFRIQVISKLSDIKSPVLTLGSTSFIHIRHGSLWVVAVTRSNVDASLVFEYLYRFLDVTKKLIGIDTVTESDVKANFAVLYEVLDETIESGHVSNMELSTLRPLLSSQPADLSRSRSNSAGGLLARANTIRRKSTGKLPQLFNSPLDLEDSPHPWRATAPKYKKNTVQINVLEDFNLLTNANGFVLRSFVDGRVTMDCRLSGTPTCSFAMSQNVSDDPFDGFKATDCTFHQSVNLKDYDEHNLIKFIPPDGEFELMSYRTDVETAPFNIYADIEPFGGSKLSYSVDLESTYPASVAASNVTIKIPVPPGTSRVKPLVDIGKFRLVEEENMVYWQIKKMMGHQKGKLAFEVEEVSTKWTAAKPPISVSFNLASYSVASHKVRFFKVKEPSMNYATVKSVNYASKAKSYEIRI
ncbi:hypothetical protein OGAPHI_003223 [Ogataea philodendri]|uniref:MHD domain-containing protein n=1 Tax=Ogataea philodendri TaxID=1378263 RepID=A0A9P8P893_9ASCO|nr:uncharacterized protein OGAPHI_003223 [Ogataea philodendri]KAH3666774.1 hypothetical protein OGAPHI_003223 [Ogataea philodendri]